MGSLPCVRQTACGGKEARHGGKEHINGKSDGERNKKAALRRAEAAVHTAAADRPAAGGAAAGSDRRHGRYHDGVPLRRGGYFGRQPCGHDQQPYHRAVCGAGHRRRGGGEPVSGRTGAEERQRELRSADPAQRSVRAAGGRILLRSGPAHDPAVLRCH